MLDFFFVKPCYSTINNNKELFSVTIFPDKLYTHTCMTVCCGFKLSLFSHFSGKFDFFGLDCDNENEAMQSENQTGLKHFKLQNNINTQRNFRRTCTPVHLNKNNAHYLQLYLA